MPFFKPVAVKEESYEKLDDLLINDSNAEISKDTIRNHLEGTEWLDNNIINFYVGYLREKNPFKNVKIMNSFFYSKIENNEPINRWLKREKVEHNDRVVFPIHVGGNHWCAGCIDLKLRKIIIMDSLVHKTPPPEPPLIHKAFRKYFQKFLNKSFMVEVKQHEQHNGYDCGVWTCAFMWEFVNQESIPDLEDLMVDTAPVRNYIKWLIVRAAIRVKLRQQMVEFLSKQIV